MMTKEPRYIAVYTGIATVLLVWSLSLAGVFIFPNNILYDTFVRLSPDSRRDSGHILLVEVDHDLQYTGDGVWLNLLHRLDEAGAAQILFSFPPPGVTGKFYDRATALGHVVFGRRQLDEPENGTDPQFIPVPFPAREKNIPAAPYSLPPDHYGIHRMEEAWFTIDGLRTPGFLVKAALARGRTDVPADDLFLVNFMSTATTLPHVSFIDIVSGNIVPELIHGRSVIIGAGKGKHSPGFQTPIHAGSRSLSLAAYNGYALDTLLTGKAIGRSRPLVTLLLIMGVTLLGLTSYTLLSGTLAMVTSGAFLLVSFAITWGTLAYLRFRLPLFEIIFTQGIVIIFIFLRSYISKSAMLKKMILVRSTRMKDHFLSSGFHESTDYWTRVINMVNQALNLERAIFLEKVRNDHRVKEIIALNTSLNDIAERRRDYERPPYITAIEENRPIAVKRFFKSAADADRQFLVPLVFDGRVQGFWAFVMVAAHEKDMETLLPTIRRFAVEIAEILYKRGRWRIARAGRKSVFKKMLRLEARENLYREVNNTIRMLGRRLSVLDLMFNAMESAVILYDTFGQVTHANEGMIRILKEMNIQAPLKMSALDLAVKLTDRPMVEMRNLLSRIIVSHDSANLPVEIPEQKRSYMLTIRPLVGGDETFVKDEAYPFALHGILFEMNDVTEIKDFSTMKSDYFQHGNHRLKEGVESISNACMLLEDDDMAGTDKKEIVDDLQMKKTDILNFINEMNDYMGKDVFSQKQQVFPVSVMKIIHDVMDGLKEETRRRRITFSVTPEIESNLALAGPGELKKLFTALFDVLMQDAYEESEIHVDAQSYPDHAVYILHNAGYGMPDEDFQRYLSSARLTDDNTFKALHDLLPSLERWEGNLSGKSGVGEGILFHLHLKGFEDRRRTS